MQGEKDSLALGGFEDGERGHRDNECSGLQSWERQGNAFPPGVSRKEESGQNLKSAQQDSCWTCDILSCQDKERALFKGTKCAAVCDKS